MENSTFKTAKRRYKRAFFTLMAVYCVAIIGGSFYLSSLEVEPLWMQIGFALGAALPLIGVLYVLMRYVEETDEYTRSLQLKAMAYGGLITVAGIFLIGALQMFEVLGMIEVFWFGPFYLLAYGGVHLTLGGREC